MNIGGEGFIIPLCENTLRFDESAQLPEGCYAKITTDISMNGRTAAVFAVQRVIFLSK